MRILLAEDDLITRRLLEAQLKNWGHDLVVCSDGQQAWEELKRETSPKLVVLDWMMPGMDGLTLSREIRKLETKPYTYIILLTAKSRKEDVIEGLEAGADDYITKPFDPQELRVRIRAATRIVQLQEELLAALRASEFQATHDSLTGLWNRYAILGILQKELSRSDREHLSIAVIMADVDHFKKINDTYGHLAGDEVLRQTAGRIVSSLRPYDSVGRYGGEEFLMVMPSCSTTNALNIAERLRSTFEKNPISNAEGTFPVTLSFGLVVVNGKDCQNTDIIIGRADESLYKAKNSGRNRVEFGGEIPSHCSDCA
ncbi:MAG: diguanylate cyclase [Deltaproteobacteria bacterium]|nr:diguanylate cyclase [Deltaproteobacteria bacterium]